MKLQLFFCLKQVRFYTAYKAENEKKHAKTNLAQAIKATNDSGPAYDANIKFLLIDRQILARILKYTMEEFQNMEISDIMNSI